MRVSVITPLYNKKKYIKSTIESVLSQTFEDWELLIVDNGSTDGSLEEAITIQDKRIQYLVSPVRGVGAARNYGLDFAKGEWIQFLDADDLLEPEHLSAMLKVAEYNSDAEIIACGWQEFVDGTPEKKVIKYPPHKTSKQGEISDFAIASAPWVVHAALIKRNILNPENHWNTQLDQYLAEDIAFWFRLVYQFSVAYSDVASALYRLETNGRSHDPRSPNWYEGVDRAIKCNLDLLTQKQISVSPGQSETLTRVYIGLFRLSRENKLFEITDNLYSEATIWLDNWSSHSNEFNLSLLLRKLLGIRLFAYLEGLFLSLKNLFL